MDKPEVKSST